MIARRTLLTGVLAAASMSLGGCTLLAPSSRRTIALVDRSGSIPIHDVAIYRDSLTAMTADLGAGDRLLIGVVGDAGRAEFRPALDVTVETTDIKLDQDERIAAARAVVTEAIGRLSGPSGGATRTRIIETIAAAAQIFEGAPRDGDRLILLSDGVEDSALIDLGRGISPAATSRVLERARRDGLLPKLDGVRFSVAGAGAEKYAEVEAFWRAYAEAVGMTVDSYGRLPIRPG